MSEQIYKVTTEGDCEGRTTKILGYARGNPNDIKLYYDNKKCYSVSTDLIDIINITPDTVREISNLTSRQKQLKAELAEIEKKLK